MKIYVLCKGAAQERDENVWKDVAISSVFILLGEAVRRYVVAFVVINGDLWLMQSGHGRSADREGMLTLIFELKPTLV